MNKADLFKAAMRAGNYRLRDWVISAFALTQDDPKAWEQNPYDYRLVKQGNRYFYLQPQAEGSEAPFALVPVDGDYDPARPLFNAWETIDLQPNDCTNLAQACKSTYGNLLFNWLVLAYPFGAKIPYQNQRTSPGKVESLIIDRLADDPKEGEAVPELPPEKMPIYVSEYLKCTDSASFASGFSQLWVPGDTEKTMTAPPGLKEYKAQLYKEYEGRLHDPAVVAEIDKKLVAFDAAYLKGDRGGEGFLITNKSKEIVRKKLFLQLGAEPGLEDKVAVDLIQNSLSEGWDLNKFPEMNNTQRAGSFNRGAQTMLGGESVKWLLRASSNLRVAKEDCGTKLGVPHDFSKEDIKTFRGFSVVTANGHEPLTEENEGKYLGKQVMIRSPMFCNLMLSDYCAVCVGPRLALNPTALSAAITAIGSNMMLIFMSAAHSSGLQVAEMDPFKELQ